MIEFRDVRKSFGPKVILDGVSLTAGSGEILFIIGTSGAGKSVLIQQLVGLLEPDGGEIWLDGRRIDGLSERDFYEVRKKCALVFQHATLFDSMTCEENVALPILKHRKVSKGDALRLAREFLGRVHMEKHAAVYPSALGDGMRKRVAVARALTLGPKYVLFDEPTTSLDPVTARQVDALILELARNEGVTCVVVSHDLRSIFSIADRVAMLYKGKVRALGTPDELRASSDPVVEQFLSGRRDGPLETT